ncbi:hypothetical protein GCM10027051_27690 [Niabella terrae]
MFNNDDGTELSVLCNAEEHKFFIPVYFKKEVLNKYYNNPQKYQVDGFRVKSNYISVKMDNNNDDYVVVFLNDLLCYHRKSNFIGNSTILLHKIKWGLADPIMLL